jgi:hypothetical protein
MHSSSNRKSETGKKDENRGLIYGAHKSPLVYASKHQNPSQSKPLQIYGRKTWKKYNQVYHSYLTLLKIRRSCALLTKNVTNAALNTIVQLASLVRGVAGTKAAQDEEHGDNNAAEDHELAKRRASLSEFGPLHATRAESLLKLLSTELVVDKTTECDAVTESLEKGDGIAEEEHGGENEKDVLENTREGKDKGRGLANLRVC